MIVVVKAVYGRMRLGRCVKENLGYLGCQADVKTIVDMKCSGRRHCDVTIPDVDLDNTKPCSELKNYLEVRYECRKGEILSVCVCVCASVCTCYVCGRVFVRVCHMYEVLYVCVRAYACV